MFSTGHRVLTASDNSRSPLAGRAPTPTVNPRLTQLHNLCAVKKELLVVKGGTVGSFNARDSLTILLCSLTTRTLKLLFHKEGCASNDDGLPLFSYLAAVFIASAHPFKDLDGLELLLLWTAAN